MSIARKHTRLALFLLAAMLAAALNAQEFRGRIRGSVVDSTGGAVVGATVTLLNTQTGVSATRQTNETGNYIFDLISPGTYTVTVEFAGFSRFQQEKIVLQQRGDIAVNAVLKAGDVKETITVSAEASMVTCTARSSSTWTPRW